MEKFDVYRISDPIFRVHARLFKVQEAVLRSSRLTIQSSKLSVISQSGVFTAFTLFVLTLFVAVFEVKLASTPVYVLGLIFLLVIWAFVHQFVGLRQAESEFDRLIGDAGGDDAEKWVDYATSVIAAFGTRLKLVTEMQEELQKARGDKQLAEPQYKERETHYRAIRAYCVDGLAKLKRLNRNTGAG